MVFRLDLQCEVTRLTYDAETRTGTLEMPAGNCCHMPGCVALFERIDPEVKRINTFAGSSPDTAYTRSANGWVAEMASA